MLGRVVEVVVLGAFDLAFGVWGHLFPSDQGSSLTKCNVPVVSAVFWCTGDRTVL